MGYVISIVMGYLLGCSNMAMYIAKLKNIDLRGKGSGNPGTSNAVIVMGWGAGLSVAIHDIGKGILTVLLARLLFPGLYGIGEVAGISCVLGHIFPFYLKFKGGKGVVVALGTMLVLNPPVCGMCLLIWILVVSFSKYVSAALDSFARSLVIHPTSFVSSVSSGTVFKPAPSEMPTRMPLVTV